MALSLAAVDVVFLLRASAIEQTHGSQLGGGWLRLPLSRLGIVRASSVSPLAASSVDEPQRISCKDSYIFKIITQKVCVFSFLY